MLCIELSVIPARFVMFPAEKLRCAWMFHCDKIEDLERQWRWCCSLGEEGNMSFLMGSHFFLVGKSIQAAAVLAASGYLSDIGIGQFLCV